MTTVEIEIAWLKAKQMAALWARVHELESALKDVVIHARPAFKGTPFRKALDKAQKLIK